MYRTFLAGCLLGMLSITAAARQTVEASRFTDNWSVGLYAGGATTLHPHYAFWNHMRATSGVELTKMITPQFGLTGLADFAFHSGRTVTTVGHAHVSLLGRLNLINLLAGYRGAPRRVEVDVLAGIGWLHAFLGRQDPENSLTSQFGVQLNVNLPHGWSIGLRPAVLFDLTGNVSAFADGHGTFHRSPAFDRHNAALQLSVGLTYHFLNHNGTHAFRPARLYNRREVDRLNARVNDLRRQLDDARRALRRSERRCRDVEQQLNQERSRHPVPQE